MLSALLLLITSLSPSQANLTSTKENLNLISNRGSVIASENCQSVQLRSFHLMDLEGQKVHMLLYSQVKQTLKEGREAGQPLSLTSTFRSCAEQNALRASNCGTLSTPAESCSPPTEAPGDSLHNYGMAVDFKCDGYPIFGNSPCYTWLKNNSSKFKLKQRPEEPWHWSLTGR